jgi:hypothetical protein
MLQSSFGQALSGSGASLANQVRSGFLAYSLSNTKNVARIIVLLEGPYNGGTLQMNTTLKSSGHLAGRFGAIPIPAMAVDSINIELRNSPSATAATTRKFRPAWLLSDGTIRDFSDTTKNYVEYDTIPGNYHLVVRHRNHISVMTASVVALSGVPLSPYDFTTAQSQAFGTNPMKPLAGGRFGMVAGDVNSSDIVSASDANLVFGSLNVTGYVATDINLSGIVTAADANTIFANLNRSSQVPSSPMPGLINEAQKEKP